ncbi:polysaccharide pyruvyl transferase family protein [Butyrivibrio sp. TB]|jgi:polysaccharide pyruvyl transferase WcaK-like protein|uniref:polysaccharide pyruvyl transferase family protein n=1 Tax=Butyrivibrio sp. TB TaxID=1520809 RepID=UPI0008CE9782|nr:polysaccharide pyruvyl transferase family protein [Butyrivibrio sp. TB]SEQ10935.1 Polysaccharide pyruvyl transferase family protein WcaK [Butyrivibrio sp. TB]
MNNKVTLYMHSGSGNHGCEAIVRSLTGLINSQDPSIKPDVMTNDRAEDLRYVPEDICHFVEEKHMDRNVLNHTLYYVYRMITGDKESFLRYRFKDMYKNPPKVGVSIGGDTYCYDYMVEEIMLTNSMLHKLGTKTILLGCSVEPELVKRSDVAADMKLYDKILARESITYNALLDAGVSKERLELAPDPAFTLDTQYLPLPDGWKEGKMIGLNLSPLIGMYAEDKDIALKCYEGLIQHIIDTTDNNIALIPHVVWDRSNDFIPLTSLYEKFKDTGRVILLQDHNATQLKGFIARCRLFIGARTHATIAAYSSCVPTLVIGYSVKARGIARDLFGTEDKYVLPVQDLKTTKQLIEGYEWLNDHADDITQKLKKSVPEYIIKARRNGSAVMDLLNQ